jgi:tight adherence protein C
LRVQSADARKLRQLEAERKALSIPPKLSVIMVFFFMPIIFIVMLYPTLSNLAGMKYGL